MTRQEFAAYLTETYGSAGEHLFVQYPNFQVFRHNFRMEPGIFPGWHMNKAHWLSVALDGTVEDEKIKYLVNMSYELTKK